ncbi:serine/threonine-protein kinase PknD [Mycobacterium intracellulare]|uniref:serine/threonine-protein kinase PknD n=1 Tax=Mycobacterium intracellulare TaxID=1767 RepID=UPI0004506D82|nr:serine/threonine-protein kinase PknD [Mycobacterium intracellulare]APD84335.1 serine/threonine protein kinase [Mycobacterium intracellulare subsp. chimaera]ARV83879.1 serine/threonine protein kinase [Mycobacterium intracellulare subsp. chimaera]ASL11163.1 pknD [Mycobacterium intracellulare subsp. chimaera]ASL23086.1 pknD [Mycobacterium intracellulare subsp. chimaera]ETZ27414.1 serine/threonine-protein kinase pknD [Mycobacterium intracellulare MIN_052511_1280]
MSDSGPASRAGSWFGPYRLVRLLRQGGMGEVYEAEDTRKRRMVALKLISQQFSGNSEFRARLQREADIAGRLTEPHVVPIHDYGEIDGRFYVDMRLVDGVDLGTLLRRDGPLAAPRAIAIISQVAAALDAAHAVGVTHRDVTPGNILITGSDFAYLADFGIARAATDPGLTQFGTAIGTYYYMAPERFTDDTVTHSADIYSLACVLSECLTGSPPYRADTIERLVAAHLTKAPPSPSQLRPGAFPPALDQVIAKGMAKRPEERYRTAGEFAAAAHDALTTSEQRKATTILREGEDAVQRAEASAQRPEREPQSWPAAETMAGPVAPRPGGTGWSERSDHHPSLIRPAPTTFGHTYGPGPDFRSPAVPIDSKRKQWIIVGAIALVALVAFIVAVAGYLSTRSSGPSQEASGQSVLPFNGIDFRLSPGGVALDSAGDVYVTSEGMYGRVVKLTAGSNATTVLPFHGLYQPQGLAVDGAGTVYVADFNNRVVSLAAGSNDQKVLPFSGLSYPEGVAVDSQGAVYVADRGNSRVVKLAAGSKTQTELPFNGLKNPDGVAVDAAGTVYVADTDNNRIVKLDANSNTQAELPFQNVSVPWGIAVDNSGTVYVTEHDKSDVLKFPAGSNTPTVLPFDGLNTPLAVAVDKERSVYIADRGNDRVVKLTP